MGKMYWLTPEEKKEFNTYKKRVKSLERYRLYTWLAIVALATAYIARS